MINLMPTHFRAQVDSSLEMHALNIDAATKLMIMLAKYCLTIDNVLFDAQLSHDILTVTDTS